MYLFHIQKNFFMQKMCLACHSNPFLHYCKVLLQSGHFIKHWNDFSKHTQILGSFPKTLWD